MSLCRLLVGVLLAGIFAADAAKAQSAPAVVVELFTSQGCPLCPPANEYLRELAARDDVIALEYHIDYYDYAGWHDPFSDAAYTRRWQNYARTLGARYQYTPFMVVNGGAHVVGSQRDEVERKIRELRTAAGPQPLVTLEAREGKAIVTVEGEGPAGTYDVVLVAYDSDHTTRITAGENRGMTMVNTRVVRDLRPIAKWIGEPLRVVVPIDAMGGTGGCTVILQRAGGGPIIAAASTSFGG